MNRKENWMSKSRNGEMTIIVGELKLKKRRKRENAKPMKRKNARSRSRDRTTKFSTQKKILTRTLK